jgi:dynein light chain LC8-type
MADDVPEWQNMWGAKVKMPSDMPDDMLKDAIETGKRVLDTFPDFDADGNGCFTNITQMHTKRGCVSILCACLTCIRIAGLRMAETIKREFDSRWSPHWHVIIGRNFGSFVTHETKSFLFYYVGDKAVMLYKAG